jgi:hypothetical protein
MPDPVAVFVSHSHADETFTQRLVTDLRVAGADVWVAESEITYDDFIKKINEGLTGRQWFVLIMTPDALASHWVEAEVNAAINLVQQGVMRGIVPVEAKACDSRTIPPLLARYHRYDATVDYAGALAGLLRALGLTSLTGRTLPPEPITFPATNEQTVSEAAHDSEKTPVIASAPPTPLPQLTSAVQPSSSPTDIPAPSDAPTPTVVSEMPLLAGSESQSSDSPTLPPQPPASQPHTPRSTDEKASASARPILTTLMRPPVAAILILIVLVGATLVTIGKITSSPTSPTSATSTPSTPSTQDLSGNWTVNSNETVPDKINYSYQLTLQQNGNQLSGVAYSNFADLSNATFTGTISGNDITLDSSVENTPSQGEPTRYRFHYVGTLSDQGHIAGSWTETLTNVATGFTLSESGYFDASK